VVSLALQPLHPWGRSTWYPLDMRLSGPQSESGHCWRRQKNVFFWPGIKPRFFRCPACSLITVPTLPSWLPFLYLVWNINNHKITVFWDLTHYSLVEVCNSRRFHTSALMMEAVNFSEMFVHFYQATWRHNLEDSSVRTSCLVNNCLFIDSVVTGRVVLVRMPRIMFLHTHQMVPLKHFHSKSGISFSPSSGTSHLLQRKQKSSLAGWCF
jgi:hypothetical protein